MAGLIAALFGGKSRPPDPDPLPGQGGYAMGAGPYGAGGFPGSTSATRTFRGTNPRIAKVRADTNYGITPVTQARYEMQHNSPAEFFGGPMLKTGAGNDTAGGELGTLAAHDPRATTTLYSQAQSQISLGVPGAQNVRNDVALKYKAAPGQVHTYQSAPRGDQGNGPTEAAASAVTVPSRFVFAGGGVQTWSVQRQMPYNGRGDGARGAALDGTRYYATGAPEFANGGQGQYGVGRLRGPNHRPTVFVEPAPWSANYYDTTAATGTPDNPGSGGQAPDMVYVSPTAGRASNRTGRTG